MKLVLLDSRDTVATAAEDLAPGSTAEVDGRTVPVLEEIPRGHKIALVDMERGSDVIRYGEVIGMATQGISVGQHVHVQNLVSKRIPGGPQ